MIDTNTLPIDAVVIARDETLHYAIRPNHRKHISAIRGVYLFNRNEITHCCEITPSYHLIHLYDEVILTDADCADDIREKLCEQYETCGGENIYVHCHEIDAKIEANKPNTVHIHGETGIPYDDSDYDEQIEGLREHFCGNHVL